MISWNRYRKYRYVCNDRVAAAVAVVVAVSNEWKIGVKRERNCQAACRVECNS